MLNKKIIIIICIIGLIGLWSYIQNSNNIPLEKIEKTDKEKLKIAEELSQKTINILKQNKDEIAVISRLGGDDIQTLDKTGMAHSGIALYDELEDKYIVYNLLNSEDGKTFDIYRTELIDFFYLQGQNKNEALIFRLEKETQEKLRKILLTNKYKQLLFTKTYNLFTKYNTKESMNCNKWILLNIMSAKYNTTDIDIVIKNLEKDFKAVPVELNKSQVKFFENMSKVRKEELPKDNIILTVSVEGFFESDKLFIQKIKI